MSIIFGKVKKNVSFASKKKSQMNEWQMQNVKRKKNNVNFLCYFPCLLYETLWSLGRKTDRKLVEKRCVICVFFFIGIKFIQNERKPNQNKVNEN